MPAVSAGLRGIGWWLAVMAGCEYDARIVANPANWETEDTVAVQVLGAFPVPCTGGAEAPVAISFALVDDRGLPISAGTTLELASGSRILVDPGAMEVILEGARLTQGDGQGAGVALTGTVLAHPAWMSSSRDLLALVVDASAQAALQDPMSERLKAAGLAARTFLAATTPPAGSPRRIAVYALARGEIGKKLPPDSSLAHAVDAVDALAAGEGGDARLFDGVVEAAAATRPATTVGGALLLISSGFKDIGSTKTAEAATVELLREPKVALYAVGLTDAVAWRRLACVSGGLFVSVKGASDLVATTAAMALAAGGRWTAAFALPPGLAEGVYRLEGSLRITLGAGQATERRAVPFDVAMDVSP